jgi:predicted O-methyltransferase YrrM
MSADGNLVWLFVVLFLLAGAVLIALAYIAHKVRRVHLMTYRLSNEISSSAAMLYRQMEALQALYAELDLGRALPPTRGWSASPDFLLLIASHARAARPRMVLECGSGTSTVVIARALQLNGVGHVHSLEHDPTFAAETREHLRRNGLTEWATVIDSPLRPHRLEAQEYSWYEIERIPDGQIDLLVVDGPPMPIGLEARYPAGPVLFPRLNPGAVVFLDDADRMDEKRIVERWQGKFEKMQVRRHDCEKGCVSLMIANELSG